jgi:hypothetical protein
LSRPLTLRNSSGRNPRDTNAIADVREHFVNITLNDFNDTAQIFLCVVIQRQSEHRDDQREVVTFVCEECKKPLREFSCLSQPPATEPAALRDHPEYARGFEAPLNVSRAAREFNRDESRRRCSHCGHLSAPFPYHEWGWEKYEEHCRAVESALKVYPGLHGDPVRSADTHAVGAVDA